MHQPRGLCGRLSSARSRRCDQCFRRCAPLAVRPPGHPHREGPRQDVGCALARAEQSAGIGLRKAARRHPFTDRVRRFDWPSLALVVLYDQREKIKTIGLRCPGPAASAWQRRQYNGQNGAKSGTRRSTGSRTTTSQPGKKRRFRPIPGPYVLLVADTSDSILCLDYAALLAMI